MNILSGRLTKKQLVGFLGIKLLSDVDLSLEKLSDQGYLKYEKIKGGKYQFILYPTPVNIRELH